MIVRGLQIVLRGVTSLEGYLKVIVGGEERIDATRITELETAGVISERIRRVGFEEW